MKKFALALALVLLPASAHPTPATPAEIGVRRGPVPAEKTQGRLEPQKAKWAPNGMKVLIIHGKRRLVGQSGWRAVEKSQTIPILKEGV